MQVWEGVRSQPTQLIGQSLCLFAWPGLAAGAWKSREEQGKIHYRKKGKLLTSLMTCLQAPQGEIKSSCKSLGKQRNKNMDQSLWKH